MLTETPAGLYCTGGDFYIDPWGAVPRAVITHAHGDHARFGSGAYLCATECAPLLQRRFGPSASIQAVPYGESIRLGETQVDGDAATPLLILLLPAPEGYAAAHKTEVEFYRVSPNVGLSLA